MTESEPQPIPPEVIQAHVKLVNLAKIEAVSLIGCDARLHPERLGDAEDGLVLHVLPPAFRFGFEPGDTTLTCGSRLIAVVTLDDAPESTSDDSDELGTEVARITAEYAISYSIPAGDWSRDVIELFAGKNGVFNAWPFFRELVHSFAGRFGIPPMLVPLLQMPATPSSSSARHARLPDVNPPKDQ